MDWWMPGIFTWEEGTPPVHLRTPLVVRSHEVLTGGPAIQLAGQSMNSVRITTHYSTTYLFVDNNKLFSGYFWHVFEKVCTTRKLPPVKEDDSGRGGRAGISSSHKPSIKVNKSLIYSYRQNEDFLSKSEFRIYATSESPPPKFSHKKLDVAIILAHFNTSSEAGGGG
ncbi:hypothetical protein B0H13DRAFT_1850420 [Mycena leptocephala]|nr:hypothetical protein B0H13DRAFT_1850420 [Mycena leptocephala]